jgi:hypothetical protein
LDIIDAVHTLQYVVVRAGELLEALHCSLDVAVVGVHEHRELAVLPLPHRARAARCDIKNLSVLGVAALPTN